MLKNDRKHITIFFFFEPQKAATATKQGYNEGLKETGKKPTDKADLAIELASRLSDIGIQLKVQFLSTTHNLMSSTNAYISR